MFEQETPLTKRINELAKKAKTVGLTEAEKEEQTLLRQEFLIKFRANFKTQLDNIEIVDEGRKRRKIKAKDLLFQKDEIADLFVWKKKQ